MQEFTVLHYRRDPLANGVKVASQQPPSARPVKRLFNALELRLFRYTAVLSSLVILTALVGIILWTLGWTLNVFYNLLLPLAVAGVLSLVLHPVVDLLEKRLHLPRLLAIIFLMVAFFIGVGGLIYALVPILLSQIVQLMTVLPDALERLLDNFSTHFPGVSSMISSSMESSGAGRSPSPFLKTPARRSCPILGFWQASASYPFSFSSHSSPVTCFGGRHPKCCRYFVRPLSENHCISWMCSWGM